MSYELKVVLNPLAEIVQKLAENKAARDRLASEETQLLTDALTSLVQSVESLPDAAKVVARETEG